MPFCTVFAIIVGSHLPFQTVLTLPSEMPDQNLFLQKVSSFAVDDQGNFHILDVGIGKVLTFNAEGRLLHAYGSMGGGPGEFDFGHGTRTAGWLSCLGDNLYVYNGGSGKVHVFDLKGNFRKTLADLSAGGRVFNLFVVPGERAVVQARRWQGDDTFTDVFFTAKDGRRQIITTSVDPSLVYQNGLLHAVKPYAPNPVSGYNDATNTLVVGHSRKPSFEVYDLKSGRPVLKEEIRFRMEAPLLTQADKDDYDKRYAQDKQPPQRIWPKFKSYYTNLAPLGDKGFLVWSLSPFHKKVNGRHLDRQGIVQGTFNWECGPDGALYVSRQELLLVTDGEGDDFVLKILKIEP